MSSLITFNGSNYTIPSTGEVGWGSNVSNYLIAIAAGCLQKTGGSFTLSAETDFGASFGLKSLYYKSRATNVASAGIVRLGNTDNVSWRNAANGADKPLTVNASDKLAFDGGTGVTGTELGYLSGVTSAIQTQFTGKASLALDNLASTAVNTSISAGASNAVDLGDITHSWRSVYIGTSLKSASTTLATATELGYLTGVTSAIQTQLGTKAPSASPTFTGTITTPLTISRALATGASSELAVSTTTATELGYVSGVTSAIQTQIDGKSPSAGSSSITTVGTVTSGTWSATTVAVNKGGTGQTTYADGQLLIGITSGNTLAKGTLTATANQTTVTNGGGSITLGTVQDIGTASTPTFGSATLSAVSSQLVLGATRTVTITAPTPATSSRTWSVPDITGNGTFAALEGTQTFTGSKTFSSAVDVTTITHTGGTAIQGTNTNDNASAGYIGEYISSTVSTFTNFPTSTQWGDLTSITLTAGDWDICGYETFIFNAGTNSDFQIAITTTAGNFTTGITNGDTNARCLPPTASDSSGATIPFIRASLTGGTTYYLKYKATYNSTAPQAVGSIKARRRR